jgi:hypothetical protein
MDRNLGATFAGTGSGLGTGLFYQWGRKDPFPATDSPEATQPGGGKFTITTNSPIVGTINYTIQHPGEFIYCTSPDWNHNDWYWGSYNNELWGHSGDKTIYDPCPAGWRVPVNSSMTKDTSPWSGFTENNGGTFDQGYSWGVNAAYPASGIRNSDESSPGEVEGISVISVLYSASPSLNYLYKSSTVYMSSYVVFLLAYTVRADGLSVRCVQE